MTAKSFFKSTWFKCISVLLVIVLVCGVFLTICNALFYVSNEERRSRAIAKLYNGETVEYDQLDVDDGVSVTSCTVNSVYEITTEKYAGDYLLSVTGKGGYSGGTVTCWIIVTVEDGELQGVKSATIASNTNQSYISKIDASDIKKMISKQDEEGFTSYSPSGISTGATYSMGAIANALNGACDYINAKYCGYVSPYADYEYAVYIEDATTVSVSGTTVTYSIVTKANPPAQSFEITVQVDDSKTIVAYTVTSYGSVSGGGKKDTEYNALLYSSYVGKGIAFFESVIGTSDSPITGNANYADNGISTGATRSNFLCLNAGAFAVANYDRAITDFGQGGTQS